MTDIWAVRRPPLTLCAILVGLALITAAVVSQRAEATPKTPSVVRVVERDFHISVVHGHLTAGRFVFHVTNHGPDEHEFIVVRADRGLPLRPDGITLDEDALEKNIVGSIEPAPAGRTTTLRVLLKRGRYALVCNMYGHYLGGMHVPLVVR